MGKIMYKGKPYSSSITKTKAIDITYDNTDSKLVTPNVQAAIDELVDMSLYNPNKNGVVSYPTKPGVYRVVDGNIAGLPSGNPGYGVLFIADGGTYLLNIYIDAYSQIYWCRTSSSNESKPSSWQKPSTTTITAIS